MLDGKMRTIRTIRDLAILLAFLGVSGCSALLDSPQDAKIREEMARAEHLAGLGNYREAISLYEKTLEIAPKNPWKERALFNLGCLYASNDNPDRDFTRSLSYLRRLAEQDPGSRPRAGIQVWVGLMESLVSLESELKASQAEFSRNKTSLEQEIAKRCVGDRYVADHHWR